MTDGTVFDEPDADVPAGDSGVLDPAPSPKDLLQVYETGELTVVGFGGHDVPNEVSVAAYRDQLYRLIESHKCRSVAFDLTCVSMMPSGLLGLLTSVKGCGVNVELFNASDDVRDVLQTAKLTELFDLREINVDDAKTNPSD